MALCDRIAWPLERCRPELTVDSVNRSLNAEDRVDIASFKRSQLVSSSGFAALEFYLLDDHGSAHHWAGKVLEYAETYFFGDWRERFPTGRYHKDPPNRVWWDRFSEWKVEFEFCLLWGSSLARWDDLGRIATYFRDDIKHDIDQSDSNRAWLLIVAGTLRGREWDDMADHVNLVRGKKAKRERLLLDFLDAILHGSDEQLSAAAKAYFNYYKRLESRRPYIMSRMAIDGTFLVNYGGYRSRNVEVPASVADHIVRLANSEEQ